MSIVALLSFVFYFIPRENIIAIFVMQIAIGLALGPKSPLVFSMYADTADYSEWKNGRRATAMVFSAASFAQKLGGALAGAIMGWLLASLGYLANQVQTESSELGIVLLMTVIPGVFALLAVFIIKYYPLNDHELNKIQTELTSRPSQIGNAKVE